MKERLTPRERAELPLTLKAYCKLKAGTMSRLARRLDIPLSVVSLWVNGKRAVPASRCHAVEAATYGNVRVETMRPDLDWTRTFHYNRKEK